MAKTVIGIDPGKGGGIAHYKKGYATAVAMPPNIRELHLYIKQLRENNDEVIVFLEKVQAWKSDKEETGKEFGIDKLLASFEQIKTVLIINEMPYVEVYPQTWQKPMMLPKDLTSNERKNEYKRFAMQNFPEANINLKTADALCIVFYGMQQLVTNINFINQKIVEFKNEGMF